MEMTKTLDRLLTRLLVRTNNRTLAAVILACVDEFQGGWDLQLEKVAV